MKFPLALAVLLLLPALSLEINKTVGGPRVMNLGQTLSITIAVSTGDAVDIMRIEDSVPEGMSASSYPASCSVDGGVLKCNYGMKIEGKTTINYLLSATEETKDIAIGNAKILYDEKGIPSVMSSNDIPNLYYIGPPRLQVNISRVIIDNKQQSDKYMALPESPISLTFSIMNSGKVTAENITLVLNVNNWGIFKTETINPIKSDENIPFQLSFKAPKNEGKAKVDVKVTWSDPIEHIAREATTSMDIEVSRPKVSVERDLQLKWRPINGVITPTVEFVLSINNKGQIPARIEVLQGVPSNLTNIQIDPVGQKDDDMMTFTFELDGGESKKVRISGESKEGDIVKFPATLVNYYDERGYKYENFTWPQEQMGTKKGIWEFIYNLTYPVDKIAKLFSILLVAISAILVYRFWKVEDPNWTLFLIPLGIGLLLMYTFFQVEGIRWVIDLALYPLIWLFSQIKRAVGFG